MGLLQQVKLLAEHVPFTVRRGYRRQSREALGKALDYLGRKLSRRTELL